MKRSVCHVTTCQIAAVIKWKQLLLVGLRGGVIGRATDLRLTGRGFESCLGTMLHSCLGQATYTCVPLSLSSIIWYRRKTGMLRDTLAPYSWPRSVSWCLAEGYRKLRSALPHGPTWLAKNFTIFYSCSAHLLHYFRSHPTWRSNECVTDAITWSIFACS